MFGKKVKKIVALLCLLSLFDTGVMTVHAASHYYEFEFKNDTINKNSETHNKTDLDQHWYISTHESGSNLSSTNIFGVRIHKEKSDNIDRYHTFSQYVDSYPMSYSVEVHTNDAMFLTGKKDNASTSTKNLKVNGRFAP